MSITINENTELNILRDDMDNIRRAVKGSPFIKQKDSLLPHPSQVDTTSDAQRKRYAEFKAGAEFPEYTKTTLASMLGKMSLNQMTVNLPSDIDYLIKDVDGDNLSMKGLAESCASNALQVKWHVLVSDYKGLIDVAVEELTLDQVERANTRATINQYTRENVADYFFSRKNGKMQLIYLLLREVGTVLNDNLEQEKVTSYMRLVLDDIGYYQQKLVEGPDGYEEGEKIYIMSDGAHLQFIPAVFVSDMELPLGRLPDELGFLSGVCDLALYAYRVSALYKEALTGLQAMINVTGMSQQDYEEFEKLNKRAYIGLGPKTYNLFPGENIKIDMLNPEPAIAPFIEYKDNNAKDVRAIGGIYNTTATIERTASEVMNEAATVNAQLNPLANSVEESLKMACAYCYMLEGKVSQENVSDAVDLMNIALPREFSISKLSTEEVAKLLDLYTTALIPRDELLTILKKGGWLESDVKDLLNQLEVSE